MSMETFWTRQDVSCVMKILQLFLCQTAMEIGMYRGYVKSNYAIEIS